MLEGYEKQFGNRLTKFINEGIPEVMNSLSPNEQSCVTDGDQPFPRTVVDSILRSDRSPEDQALALLVVMGTWMNASSGSHWAVGPIADGRYSERIGIGTAAPDGQSFTPLMASAEQIVAEGIDQTKSLDILQSLAEFDKRQNEMTND